MSVFFIPFPLSEGVCIYSKMSALFNNRYECCSFFDGINPPYTNMTITKMLVISRFGFEGWVWVLIASVPDLCKVFTFLFLWVLGMGCVNLLWNSLGLPYHYVVSEAAIISN